MEDAFYVLRDKCAHKKHALKASALENELYIASSLVFHPFILLPSTIPDGHPQEMICPKLSSTAGVLLTRNNGQMFVPPHLRLLHVAKEPQSIPEMDIFRILVSREFGLERLLIV